MGECFFWYRPTRVVPDQRPLNGRCCCCCSCTFIHRRAAVSLSSLHTKLILWKKCHNKISMTTGINFSFGVLRVCVCMATLSCIFPETYLIHVTKLVCMRAVVVELTLQMSEWIANNREVFLVTYTQIGSSHQQAVDLQSEHNQFAMSAMVCSVDNHISLITAGCG